MLQGCDKNEEILNDLMVKTWDIFKTLSYKNRKIIISFLESRTARERFKNPKIDAGLEIRQKSRTEKYRDRFWEDMSKKQKEKAVLNNETITHRNHGMR